MVLAFQEELVLCETQRCDLSANPHLRSYLRIMSETTDTDPYGLNDNPEDPAREASKRGESVAME